MIQLHRISGPTHCLSLALATVVTLTSGGQALNAASVVPSPGTSSVTVSGTLPTSQADNYFVYHFVDGNGTVFEGASLVSSTIPANLPLSATFTLPSAVVSGYATVLGLYSLSPGLVTVALNSTAGGNAIGLDFASVFSGTTETALAAAIAGATTSNLVAFLDANSTLFAQFNGNGTQISVSNVKFSTGTADGTIGVTVLSGATPSATPEPSSFLLAAPALILVLRKKMSAS